MNLGGTGTFRPITGPTRRTRLAAFRYIVHDVDACVPVYRDILGFEVKMQATGFAALVRGDLTLFLNQPGMGSAGKAGGIPRSPVAGTASRSRFPTSMRRSRT